MREGWEYKNLSAISTCIEDGDWIESKDQSPDGIRLIQTGNIGIGFFKDKGDKAKYISEDTFKRLHCNEIFEGDILISRLPDPVGRACILPNLNCRCITAVDCSIVRLKKQIIRNEWLTYFMQSQQYFSKVKSQCTGSTRLRITRKKLGDILVPVPPLSEQQEIVDYLDTAFAKIDAMKANAEKALEEGKALFQSALKQLLEPKEGWEEKKLVEMAEIQSGFAFKSTQFQNKGKYQVIRMGNVRPGVIRYDESPVYIDTMDESKIDKALLKVGDMIITQTGSRNKRDYGFTVLIEKENLLLNQRIARIRVVDIITNKYLLYFSWTNYFRDQYFANEGGTVGQGNVGIDAIKYAIISYPPLSKQQTIVATLDSIKSKVDQLQENYDRIAKECDTLKQAILRQVFE